MLQQVIKIKANSNLNAMISYETVSIWIYHHNIIRWRGIDCFQRKLFHVTKHLQTLALLLYELNNPDGASALTLPYAFFFFLWCHESFHCSITLLPKFFIQYFHKTSYFFLFGANIRVFCVTTNFLGSFCFIFWSHADSANYADNFEGHRKYLRWATKAVSSGFVDTFILLQTVTEEQLLV